MNICKSFFVIFALNAVFRLPTFASDSDQMRSYNNSHNHSAMERSQVSEDYISWIFSDATDLDKIRKEHAKHIAFLEPYMHKLKEIDNPYLEVMKKYQYTNLSIQYRAAIMDFEQGNIYEEDMQEYYGGVRRAFSNLLNPEYIVLLPSSIKTTIELYLTILDRVDQNIKSKILIK